jgi:site-specific recombinase XerD
LLLAQKERIPIPLESMKLLVSDTTIDLRTRAMIAVQYACGCRAGELFRYTHHKLLPEAIKRRRNIFKKSPDEAENMPKVSDFLIHPADYVITQTEGLIVGNVAFTEDRIIFTIPNFKNRKRVVRVGFMLNKEESWLCAVFKEYFDSLPFHIPHEQVFPICERYARGFIAEALRKHGINDASHILRHSRATELVHKMKNVNSLKHYMGHASLESTNVYLHTDDKEVSDEVKDFYAHKKEEKNAV